MVNLSPFLGAHSSLCCVHDDGQLGTEHTKYVDIINSICKASCNPEWTETNLEERWKDIIALGTLPSNRF